MPLKTPARMTSLLLVSKCPCTRTAVLDRTLPMIDIKAAYALMGSCSVKGKLVMVN